MGFTICASAAKLSPKSRTIKLHIFFMGFYFVAKIGKIF